MWRMRVTGRRFGPEILIAATRGKKWSFRLSSSLPPNTLRQHKELRADVKHLGKILGSIIAEENQTVYEHVESLRQLAKEFRSKDNSKDVLGKMGDNTRTFAPEELKGVARAFSHFLALSNCAEVHHRLEGWKSGGVQGDNSPFTERDDSIRGAIKALLEEEGLSPREVRETLLKQRVELVLTAHPTEVNRKTTLHKHRRIGKILAANDQLDKLQVAENSYEREELESALRREIASLWASDEIRRFKPSPIDEAEGALAVFESVLWHAVPSYLRKLDKELVRQLSAKGLDPKLAGLPLEVSPIRFASWVGGDRDGNPNVTPETTIRACALNRWMAATLYLNDINALYDELSMSTGFSSEVRAMAGTVTDSVDEHELYRRILSQLRARLIVTIQQNYALAKPSMVAPSAATEVSSKVEAFTKVTELLNPLKIIHSSLLKSGRSEIANGLLADTIRRVAVFGLTIMPLDIRQESGRHLEAIDAITQHLGLGSYAQWSEQAKINWLVAELNSPRPLLPHDTLHKLPSLGFSETVIDTINTFRAASLLGEGSLGAYVISQAKATSDVLAVALLQQEFGMTTAPVAAGEGGNGKAGTMMRVVPLFETLDDLTNAPEIIERLLNLPAYLGRINGRQEVMVGYSDSAKDAGRLAACYAQFKAQENLLKIAKAKGIELTFFHGKGGTVGRGGNPAVYRAVLSHPPNTIDGRFRVTEQGEMITQNFSSVQVAERTLDVYTAAVCREKHYKHVLPKDSWRTTMESVSERSCDAYRDMVRNQPDFVSYFRTVTPELELGALNVGSRPAKRNPKGGIESLRAIPWIFAWSQTRANVPTWLGVSSGLANDLQELKDMYSNWPWFREIIDLIAMILCKTEPVIAGNYDKQLIPSSTAPNKENLYELGKTLRNDWEQTKKNLLQVSSQGDLFMGNPILERELEVRNPYLDALNVVQCEVMRRLRNNEYISPEEELILRDALLITINGIAAGLRNSG